MSLLIGIDFSSACFVWFERIQSKREANGKLKLITPTPDHLDRRWSSLLFFFSATILLFIGGAVGTAMDNGCLTRRRLWLATTVSPIGVWTRWYWSRFNGFGFGKDGQCLKWIPWGTFLINVFAATVEAALSTVILAVHNDTSSLFNGALQLGLLGSMSTVSTFFAEVRLLRIASSSPWHAYVYVLLTFLVSFIFGLCAYSIPVWVYGFNSRYNRIAFC